MPITCLIQGTSPVLLDKYPGFALNKWRLDQNPVLSLFSVSFVPFVLTPSLRSRFVCPAGRVKWRPNRDLSTRDPVKNVDEENLPVFKGGHCGESALQSVPTKEDTAGNLPCSQCLQTRTLRGSLPCSQCLGDGTSIWIPSKKINPDMLTRMKIITKWVWLQARLASRNSLAHRHWRPSSSICLVP
ncbi:uncharacterized protein LOC143655850 [Tamandua tetradactyla]|uniref:uncharacterized protein LOC143655850 n=1 Tax=Tamandua tetradactyla TaxID=48850 RepID=UPI00405453DB